MNIWVVIHPMMMLPNNLCFTYFSQSFFFMGYLHTLQNGHNPSLFVYLPPFAI